MNGWSISETVLQRLIRGLVAYGIIGLSLSLVAAIAVLVTLGRLSAVGDSVDGGAGQLGTVLERTAAVLDDAATSAASFGTTIDNGSAALTAAATDLRTIVPQLRDIETQANAIDILGSQPLAPLARLFGQIAAQLGDLDGRLDSVATNLSSNRAALTTNAASLAALASDVRSLSSRLAPRSLTQTFDDARWFALALLAVVLAGVTVPAAAALALAWWLRRALLGGALSPGAPTPA